MATLFALLSLMGGGGGLFFRGVSCCAFVVAYMVLYGSYHKVFTSALHMASICQRVCGLKPFTLHPIQGMAVVRSKCSQVVSWTLK